MSFDIINERDLVLVGCGNMGSALLRGWLQKGLAPSSTYVIDPRPSEWLERQAQKGIRLNEFPPKVPAVVILATKPQMIEDVVKQWSDARFHQTLFLSIAAGTSLATLEAQLSAQHPVVRAMPNTPVTILEGASAYIGNDAADPYLPIARALLESVGIAIELEDEAQMNAVTALSGSGPAYIFQMAESMALSAQKLGLAKNQAEQLAIQTIHGAGQLLSKSVKNPKELREAVTSPGGTTQAALNVLKDENSGLDALLAEAVRAAFNRSRELE